MADMFDIFNSDAFSVTSMTSALQEVKYKPSYITRLGLFQEESVDTLSIAIEKAQGDTLAFVPSSPRGSPGKTMGFDRRDLRNLTIPHYQVDDGILADRVQSVRAFGETRATENIQTYIAKRAAKARQFFELTEERQKLALITQGLLLDADGSTMFNYYTEMGESAAPEIALDLANASPAKGILRETCDTILQDLATSLDGLPYDGVVALMGNQAWKDFVKHKEVYDIYIGWSRATELQANTIGKGTSGLWGAMEFGGITWVNYRGGQGVSINTDKVYFVPTGVPDLFKTVYGPADYLETVNTNGLPMYAKQWLMPNGKGVNLEFQTNVLHYLTRPRVLRSARRQA